MYLEDELKQLQHRLALVDLLTERRARPYEHLTELLIVKLGPLKVKMYQETGHQVPHVHIDYGRHNHVASYSIDEGRRLAGTLPAKYDREVLDWIAANRTTLLQAWQALSSGSDITVLVGELLEGEIVSRP